MWVPSKRTWISQVLFGGRTLPKIWSRVGVVGALALVADFGYHRFPWLNLKVTPFTLLGVPLGIFLGFRNNASYDRFWEGRKLWGSLVNTSRSLARQLTTFVDVPEGSSEETAREIVAEREALVRMVVAYVHSFRHHLRDQDTRVGLDDALSKDELSALTKHENVPVGILGMLGDRIAGLRRRGAIHPMHAPLIEQCLVSMTDVQGACERIKSTPLPHSYNVLLHRIVAVYCILLPFGLAQDLGWASVLVVVFVSYALFGLDAIGDELEQPFGTDTNDLALFAISRTIEINLLRRIGAEDVPPPAKAKDNVLD